MQLRSGVAVAVAVVAALIRPLAWELPYAVGAGPRKLKKKKKMCFTEQWGEPGQIPGHRVKD